MRSPILALLCLPLSIVAQEISPKKVYPPFGVGPTGIFATIEKDLVVTIQAIEPRSPAGKTTLQPGDVILAAGRRDLAVPDPRVPLGLAIGSAEARDGKLLLDVKRGERTARFTVQLPQLGPYSDTWPLKCGKSDAIVRATAEFIVASQQDDGAYKFGNARPVRDDLNGCLAGLFLLSTGETRYVKNVRLQVRKLADSARDKPTGSSWHLGYQGILLAEYYLESGDRYVLAGLKSLCDRALETQAAGGWGHGGIPNPGYTQSGLMNSAGIPVLTTLILARECGLEIEEAEFNKALKFLYRMVGHGCICYGDHRSELWWPNTNGRNAKTACALSLLDEPRFKQGAEHLALLVADSYYKPEFGHTGGGFNVMWRALGSAHVPEKRKLHVQRQMRRLAWYYDLCRQAGGGFSMLPTPPDNARYSGLAWGTGAVGLTYTSARKTLRITGAPKKRSAKTKPVSFNWGTDADLAFFSTDDAEGFGEEVAPPHEVYDKLIGKKKDEATVTFAARHLLHYSPLVRSWAARNLRERKDDPEVIGILKKAVTHDDPRVRRAVFDAVSGYDNWGRPMRRTLPPETVSKEFLPHIVKTLTDPQSAWWEIDGALFALGRAQADDIRSQIDVIDRFSKHEEWYLREGAFWALAGLGGKMAPAEFNRLTAIYDTSVHVFARSSYDAGFRQLLKTDKIGLSAFSKKEAAGHFGRTLHSALVADGYGTGGIHEAAHRTMMALGHFNPDIYGLMIDDFAKYLRSWEPYYQHSVWLVTGSKWQPGLLKVLKGLGSDGKPICLEFKKVLARYDKFDPKRIGGDARELEEKISNAVILWESAHGKVE